ncbi:NAC domain-containing protein 62-like [Abrus precatorius]|uniref:NAC domain-containing protein 62-like n=1 Tax=Abrus precatorius TaxID=3816 RepID=A0A8B8JT47_ABRPR|nr:NAC domain-containing protein 62-like [Abrus precatorius]XP_027334672.1 NAC domain-containing protein 62-like [Abrus precatorius]
MENTVPTLENVPIGFRFRPKDEELVDHYLRHKLLDDEICVNIIPEIDLCKVDPWEVPAKSSIKSEDPEWFFFSPVDYKYSNSKRVNRTTKGGFWKSTGNERYIKEKGTNNVIGTKKTLVFYEGRVSHSVKSNWVIHEYHHAVTFLESQRTFVLCRLMKKDGKKDEKGTDAWICDEADPSRNMASNYENQVTSEGVADVGSTLPEMSMDTIFPAMQQAEKYFPQEQLSPIAIEQKASFTNSPFHYNAYFENENIIIQTPFETIEEENDFISSRLVDDVFVINKEDKEYVFVNSSTQSKSLKRVHCKSSEVIQMLK